MVVRAINRALNHDGKDLASGKSYWYLSCPKNSWHRFHQNLVPEKPTFCRYYMCPYYHLAYPASSQCVYWFWLCTTTPYRPTLLFLYNIEVHVCVLECAKHFSLENAFDNVACKMNGHYVLDFHVLESMCYRKILRSLYAWFVPQWKIRRFFKLCYQIICLTTGDYCHWIRQFIMFQGHDYNKWYL